MSEPSVIVTTPAGLAGFQKAFACLPAQTQQKLGYPTKGNVFIVDPDHDDYGASVASLDQQATSVIGGWKVSNWKTLLPPNPAPFTPPKYTPSESATRAAVIFWSSGTSGKSKGVILSHQACASALVAVWHYATLGADERLVGLPPFYHIFGERRRALDHRRKITELVSRLGQRAHGVAGIRRDDNDCGKGEFDLETSFDVC